MTAPDYSSVPADTSFISELRTPRKDRMRLVPGQCFQQNTPHSRKLCYVGVCPADDYSSSTFQCYCCWLVPINSIVSTAIYNIVPNSDRLLEFMQFSVVVAFAVGEYTCFRNNGLTRYTLIHFTVIPFHADGRRSQSDPWSLEQYIWGNYFCCQALWGCSFGMLFCGFIVAEHVGYL